jgi:alginate O-acetyltransferase complex protein AlgI
MSIISIPFALFFLVVLALYYWLPHRLRIGVLLVAGYVFYASWHWFYVPLLAGITALFYFSGRRIAAAQTNAGKRAALIFGVAASVITLFAFQYVNFFSQSVGAGNISSLIVPLGISFYTFAGIGYLADVFRAQLEPETRLDRFATFIAFFPTLTSGPIERAGHLIPQLDQQVNGRTAKTEGDSDTAPDTTRNQRTFDEARATEALRLILWGAFKKLVIADRLAIYVNAVYDAPTQHNGVVLLIATLFYAFQLYADFSGYTDVVIGIARLLGIDLLENFRQPYYAMSIRDFWNRWHISLSTWIRDYLFMPLSRNSLRRSKGKYPRAIQAGANFIVMLLVGLWHGPSWTFVVWGALHGLYLSVESLLGLRVRNPRAPLSTKVVRTLLTFVLVTFAWVFFRANSLSDAGYIISHFADWNVGFTSVFTPFEAGVLLPATEFWLSVILIILLLFADAVDFRRGLLTAWSQQHWVVRWATYYAAGAAILFAFVYGVTTQPFIYAQF